MESASAETRLWSSERVLSILQSGCRIRSFNSSLLVGGNAGLFQATVAATRWTTTCCACSLSWSGNRNRSPKNRSSRQDKEQIVARFMVEELSFRGIVSTGECAAVLSAYDNGEYPANSGWNYVRFFVPKAYAAGLRIRESALRLWDAFEDAHIKANLNGPAEIPMKYFAAAVESALLLSSARDSETLQFDALFWSEMVERSRYVVA